MTGNTAEYIEHILALLEPIKTISSARFFGGTGLKCDGIQFAMLMGNTVFLVVDDTTRAKYEEYGMECFWYKTKKKKVLVRKYHQVPDEILDEPAALIEWATEAITIARRLSNK